MKRAILLLLLASLPGAAQNRVLYVAHYDLDPIAQPGLVDLAPGTAIYLSPRVLGFMGITMGPEAKDLAKVTATIYPLGLDTSYPITIDSPYQSVYDWYAILPATVPIGPAEIVLYDVNGVAYGPAPVRIVRTRFGVDSRGPWAYSPAYVGRVLPTGGEWVKLAKPAVPGDTLWITGTGLGLATLNEIRVEVGGVPMPIRSAGLLAPDTDQILFDVPKDTRLFGCYLPIEVRIGDQVSNRGSIPVSSDPAACPHPLGLSVEEMKALDQNNSVPVLLFSIGGGPGVVREWAFADFEVLGYMDVAMRSGLQLTDAQEYSCSVELSSQPQRATIIRVRPLDAGAALRLQGGAGNADLTSSRVPQGYAFDPTPPALSVFQPGDWKLSGPGGADLSAFEWPFVLPPPLEILNLDALKSMPAPADFEIRWNGTLYRTGDKVTVRTQLDSVNGTLVCASDATSGRMQLPLTRIWPLFATSGSAQLTSQVARRSARPLLSSAPLKAGGTARGMVVYELGSQITWTRVP